MSNPGEFGIRTQYLVYYDAFGDRRAARGVTIGNPPSFHERGLAKGDDSLVYKDETPSLRVLAGDVSQDYFGINGDLTVADEYLVFRDNTGTERFVVGDRDTALVPHIEADPNTGDTDLKVTITNWDEIRRFYLIQQIDAAWLLYMEDEDDGSSDGENTEYRDEADVEPNGDGVFYLEGAYENGFVGDLYVLNVVQVSDDSLWDSSSISGVQGVTKQSNIVYENGGPDPGSVEPPETTVSNHSMDADTPGDSSSTYTISWENSTEDVDGIEVTYSSSDSNSTFGDTVLLSPSATSFQTPDSENCSTGVSYTITYYNTDIDGENKTDGDTVGDFGITCDGGFS